MAKQALTRDSVKDYLDSRSRAALPGVEYIVVDSQHVVFEYAGGWADIRNQKPMQAGNTASLS